MLKKSVNQYSMWLKRNIAFYNSVFFQIKNPIYSKKYFLLTPILFNLWVQKENLVIIDQFNVKKFEIGDERKMNRERNRDNIILGLIGHK